MKKQRILEAAARLFAERGFAQTPTSLLAREAGVAEGTIFRHFRSKDHILLDLIVDLRERIAVGIRRYLETRNPKSGLERITATIQAFYAIVRDNRGQFAVILRDPPDRRSAPGNSAFEHSRVIYQMLHEQFRKDIELGQRQGCIRASLHPGDTACLLTSALVGLMRVAHLDFLRPSEDMLRHFAQCAEAMLAA